MKFFKQRTSDLTAVASNVTFTTPQLFRGEHQVTVITLDSSGDPATATGGTFAVQIKGAPDAVAETLTDNAGTAIAVPADALYSVKFSGNAEEVVVVPSSITGATHYKVTLTQGE